jgi:hypothetical protein
MTSCQPQFNTNCTILSHLYHFIQSPISRGTIDILWTSLTVLFLCTWSVQHPPVPMQRRSKGLKQKLANTIIEMSKKFGFMVLTLVYPESQVELALVDWFSAHESKTAMKDFAVQDAAEWTEIHGFYSDMGGFVIVFDPANLSAPCGNVEGPKPISIPPSRTFHSIQSWATNRGISSTDSSLCDNRKTTNSTIQERPSGHESREPERNTPLHSETASTEQDRPPSIKPVPSSHLPDIKR